MSLSSSSSSSYQHIHMATTSISTDDNSHAVVKGKRTKRQRSTTQHQQTSSTTSSAGTTAASDEDEDLASCLILLAQGRALDISSLSTKPPGERKIAASSRMFAEAPTTAGVFECKTCNKCFPTFQALGGHRASHKKPKTATATNMPTTTTTEDVVDEKVAAIADENQRNTQLLGTPSATPIQPSADIAGVVADGYSGGSSSINPIKGRVHECSICGSEFSSGQALGGHMRRHRSATTTAAAATAPAPEPHQVVLQGEQEPAKKERSSVFSLDLNLPAPSDDDRSAMDFPKPLPSTAGFTFFSPSAVALVDCHY